MPRRYSGFVPFMVRALASRVVARVQAGPGGGACRPQRGGSIGAAMRVGGLMALLVFSGRSGTAQCPIVWTYTPAIIDYTSTWKYRPNTNAPGFVVADEWTLPDFDDAAWFSGEGLFGYETNPFLYGPFAPFNTFVAPPRDGTGPLSSYFRLHFTWSNTAPAVFLNFTNLVDDGMIAYLNGMEIFSFNMPNTPRPMTWDLVMLPQGNDPFGEGVPFRTNIFNPNLRQGDNVLAVELHQSSLASGDDVFGLKMTAAIGHFDPAESLQPTNQTVSSWQPVTLVAEACGAPVAGFQWYENAVAIPGATSAGYSFTNDNPCAAALEPRFFNCQVTTPAGSYRTRTATIRFYADDFWLLVQNVWGSFSPTNVFVEFSHSILPDTAVDIFNYLVEDGSGRYIEVAEARPLSPYNKMVALTLAEPLAEATTYVLRFAENGVMDDCGQSPLPTWQPFQSWTPNPRLQVVRSGNGSAYLQWADLAFSLEIAPTPLGPWTPQSLWRGTAPLYFESGAQFFRLRQREEK